jgi:hypothetical protein
MYRNGGFKINEAFLRTNYGWAIDIVKRHFSKGLEYICNQSFLERRYTEFQERRDPIYSILLEGMQDEQLAKTFVSYWTIGQTLAVQSRFWLENAVADLILYQAKNYNRLTKEIYNQEMLSAGFPKITHQVADFGEEIIEHSSKRDPWEVEIQLSALKKVDQLVGKEERKGALPTRSPNKHAWEQNENAALINDDRRQLQIIATALHGPPAEKTLLNCNLLVIEPNKYDKKYHAWAFRFINPKTFASHANRKQERVNLLRLYALLVQEKILRDPEFINVCVAELLPRKHLAYGQDRYPDYFSPVTYWSSEKLWDFINVPFEVVTCSIHDVAKKFREKLQFGLGSLLPVDRRILSALQ